jgi:hypothetical protein
MIFNQKSIPPSLGHGESGAKERHPSTGREGAGQW